MIAREIDTQSSCRPFAHLFRLTDALSVDDVAAQLGIRYTGPDRAEAGRGIWGAFSLVNGLACVSVTLKLRRRPHPPPASSVRPRIHL